MKKIVTFIAVAFFFGGILLSSCSTQQSFCPAYPPSTFQGDAQVDQEIMIDELNIENQENL